MRSKTTVIMFIISLVSCYLMTSCQVGLGGQAISYPFWFVHDHILNNEFKDFNSTRDNLNTPFEIQTYMFAHFRYFDDTEPGDEDKPAEVTYDEGGGDCDDWAMFALACMPMKYTVFMLSFFRLNRVGHATCVWDKGEGRFVTMGSHGIKVIYGKLSDIPGYWHSNWVEACITQRNGTYKFYDRDEIE